MNIQIRNHEFIASIGLWLWLAIYQVLENQQAGWLFYLSMLLLLLPTQLPNLVFAALKPRFLTRLNLRQYLYSWLGCYFVALPLFTVLCMYLAPPGTDSMLLWAASAFSIMLNIVLLINDFYQKKVRHKKWIKKIGLENSIFIAVVLIALTVSVMAVSSKEIPLYDTPNQLLVGFEFSLNKVIRYFGTFLLFFLQFLLVYLSGYLLFLVNSRILVSQVLKTQGLLLYILCLLTIVALLYPLLGQLLSILPINQTFGRDIFSPNPFLFENAAGAISIMLISLPIVLSLQWAKQNQQIMLLEKEKSQTELDLLKQQLNPHFFFNTLNNLYALSLQHSDKTSESILRLAELMRYTIYKGKEPRVKLAQEIGYIEDYIGLQQLRLKKKLDFSFEKEINDETACITPLLLIVFVENAFKHGVEQAEQAAHLRLYLRLNHQKLYFSCENSIEENTGNEGGIGLINLEKRLTLVYPGRYRLHTQRTPGLYTAELEIEL